MGSSSRSSASGGTGFVGLLTITFIILKLTHVVGWSWWLVLAPLWISVGLVIACCLALVGVALLSASKS